MKWSVCRFEELNNFDLYKILQLRIDVFMLEQECLYAECDNKDLMAKHIYAKEDDEVIAYARLLPPNVSYTDPSIGRVVVSPPYRSQKLGRILMEKAISQQQIDFPRQMIRISAQHRLQSFYENLGFIAHGSIYLEDNIPHIEMALKSY